MSMLLVYPVVAVLVAVVVIAVKVAHPNPTPARGRKRAGRTVLGVVGGVLGAAVAMTLAGLAGVAKRN
ncbi:hypothetical protein ACWDSJ_28295 [Nocardia sp. NPDC003482]